ncbi:hypothetical protein [Chamaesiphon sp. OTE_8_metabat_110]|uniref:hypothetical protein n=1 Tax=Chamaesiphon sp. OTE_8_metabat_110 TaxID=2964696 RepID=UPI00286A891D|nr:hypothetical protein [Chamaesiphon sp. OTE_8_metabat_110]
MDAETKLAIQSLSSQIIRLEKLVNKHIPQAYGWVSPSRCERLSEGIWTRYKIITAIEKAVKGNASPLIRGEHYELLSDDRYKVNYEEWMTIDWSRLN